MKSNLKHIEILCERHGVLRLDVFGSILRDDFCTESDIDFLVLFKRDEQTNAFNQYFDLKEALEDLLKREIDLVCANAIRNPFSSKRSSEADSHCMQHKLEKLVQDAQSSCEELHRFTHGKTYEDVLDDRGLQLILERLFEILGEALYRLRNVDEAAFQQITDGHRIIGTRNLLAHGYDIVDHEILWAAVQSSLKHLEEDLERLFNR